jgi:hypothetical protein
MSKKPDKDIYVGSLPSGAKFTMHLPGITMQGTVIKHSIGQTTVRWEAGYTIGISPRTIVQLKEEQCLIGT